jgi:tRNA(Ile2) C34 agmatinyltransferase TiaS
MAIPKTARFPAPPVFTGFWTEKDWETYIGAEELERARAEEAAEVEREPQECPACSGPGEELGALGRTTRYRCRNCGLVW